MTVDPPRLRDLGSEASDDLRALLRSADADGPSPAQLQRLTARLEPQLSAPVTTASTITVGKVIAIVLVVAVVAGVIAYVVGRASDAGDGDDAPPARSIATAGIDAAVGAAVDAAPDPAIDAAIDHADPAIDAAVVVTPPRDAASIVIDVPPTTARSPRQRPIDAGVERPPAPLDAGVEPPPAPLEDELAVLGRAQRALVAGDAATALELAERHATLYRSATMIEEREAIAIEALARLGRADAAAARFARFQTAYPRSSYRHRLERLLENPE